MRTEIDKASGKNGQPRAGGGGMHRVAQALRAEGAVLHELDYEDLGLSASGLRLVRRAALDVLRRFLSVEERELSAARALALFLDRVFWNESTGGLVLCADFPDRSYCVPIPAGQWGLKQRARRLQ
jgi:hypothetical protein